MSLVLIPEVPSAAEGVAFDLETIMESYKGRAKLNRILHLACLPSPLAEKYQALKVPAIQLVISTLQTIPDIVLYNKTITFLKTHCEYEEDIDIVWLKNTHLSGLERTTALLEKLATITLEGKKNRKSVKLSPFYKANLNAGHEFAGMGQTADALRHYHLSDDPQSGQTICRKWLYILTMHIDHDAVSDVSRSADIEKDAIQCQKDLFKASGMIERLGDEQQKINALGFLHEAQSALNIMRGLIHLAKNEYGLAAPFFVICAAGYGSHTKAILAPLEVTAYATLCSLAVQHPSELSCEILQNDFFKPYVFQVPPLRNLIHAVRNADVPAASKLLEALASPLLLDPYLSKDVDGLAQSIADSTLLRLLRKSTAAVSLDTLALRSELEPDCLETIICQYLDDKRLKGKYDIENKVFTPARPRSSAAGSKIRF